MKICIPSPVVFLRSPSPVLLEDASGRMELCETLACTVGDKHLKAFPVLTLNCHRAILVLPPPQKCCMGLHEPREGEVLRAQVHSYFLILQHTVKKLMNNNNKKDRKVSEIVNLETEMKISVSTPRSPDHLISFSNLCVSSMMSHFLSPYSLVAAITDLSFCCCYHSFLMLSVHSYAFLSYRRSHFDTFNL